MFSECANPDCGKAFDYRQGHFFRFHKSHRADVAPPNTHSVEHLWLCGKCSENYTLEDVEGYGVMLLGQTELFLEPDERHAVSVA
jgi:hypothetical protein